MAHSFESISTHPERRKKVEPQHIDIYGPLPEIDRSECDEYNLRYIRNHDLLQTVPFTPPSAGGWSICQALEDLEDW